MRKICIFTGSRAEYGLLRSVMQGIQVAETLQLQILARGMRLSPEFAEFAFGEKFVANQIKAQGAYGYVCSKIASI